MKKDRSNFPIYICLFLVTLSTLLMELLLTRIFSATMWYHFAFVSISVAMFGMTVGAVIVQKLDKYFSPDKVVERIRKYSTAFALSIPLCFISHLTIRVDFSFNFMALFSTAFFYFINAIPFVFSGIVVSLALTRYPAPVSKLYFWDLAGASLACLLIIPLLDLLDAPSFMLLFGAFAASGAFIIEFIANIESNRRERIKRFIYSAAIILVFIILAFWNHREHFIKIHWYKGTFEKNLEYEKWNSFSRISVFPSKDRPFGWGINKQLIRGIVADQKKLYIDSNSLTVLTRFDGDFSKVSYLNLDISALGHYLKAGGDIAIVGAGGGRDILTALLFGFKNIYAIEINDAIIDLLENKYAEYTGRLYQYPQVKLINDEARSWIVRSKNKYDLIQVSFIDTWAATSSGAFVLTENSLYTVDSWKKFLDKLKPGGILSYTRWSEGDFSPESMRLVSLAVKTLRYRGIKEPQKYIIFARSYTAKMAGTHPCATLLLSNIPYSKEQIQIIRETAKKNRFMIIIDPETIVLPAYKQMFSDDYERFINESPVNLAAPTDDKPYFFNFTKIKDVFFSKDLKRIDIKTKAKHAAIYILGSLLIVVVVLAIVFILMPLKYALDKKMLKTWRAVPTTIYFAAIGCAFMLIEISQLNRLNAYLGHPIYGLSVGLFLLLLSSSIGSLWSNRFASDKTKRASYTHLLFFALIVILLIYAFLTPIAIDKTDWFTTPLRILIAAVLLMPVGFLMGIPFPLGMTIARETKGSPAAFYWGINGATSVASSVIAVALSIQFGITATFLAGALFYLIAYLSIRRLPVK